jgi:hypothetical protein
MDGFDLKTPIQNRYDHSLSSLRIKSRVVLTAHIPAILGGPP